MIIFGSVQGLFYFYSTTSILPDELNHLKTSAGEIIINTPENKTYIEPDSGYYLATYGFEDALSGTPPIGWTDDSGTGAYIEVYDNLDDHNKILRLVDNSSTYQSKALSPVFALQTHGTIECWMWPTDATERHSISLLQHDTLERILLFSLAQDKWQYYDGSWIDISELPTPLDGTWYHVAVHFECSSGGYMGLNQYEMKFEVNGVSSNVYALENNLANVDQLSFSTITTHMETFYVDAVGYSWDDIYTVSDNLNEGLLLSYYTNVSLDWQGYSLDDEANRTIQGNTVIPMPADGQHHIQVFGIDTIGTMYESNLRYFSIYPINIITPEDRTYTEPDSGYFPGTYGFENDEDGTIPEDWDLSDDRGGTCQVISELGGHKKVVEIHDDDDYFEVHLETTFTPQTSGSIEWWWMTTSTSAANYFELHDTSSRLLSIQFDESGYIRYDSSSGWNDIKTYNAYQWYLMRIDFDSITDTYDVYIDGTLEVNDASYDTSGGSVEKIFTGTGWTAYNFSSYYDAISFSWDLNYNIGDNSEEGLLLSFDMIFSPDCIGYSLDNQATVTILGNTTIPMPSDGQHHIQVFGNDTMGIIYESNLRYFSVNYGLNYINIITPEDKTYTEPDSGYYPGTYGFENQLNGDEDLEISWIGYDNPGSCIAIVQEEFEGHKKVVNLHDVNSIEPATAYHYSTQTYGTVEFWFSTTDASEASEIYFYSGGTPSNFIWTRIENTVFQYHDGSSFTDIPNISSLESNTWYHIRIDFRCYGESTPWQGLNQNRWRFILDGVDSGELTPRSTKSSILRYNIVTSNLGVYDNYIDAVGHSWDSNYALGDNLNEGLLLSFDMSFSPEWIGYSLDNQAIVTVLGNHTISMPSYGQHQIQVFGNNSLGDMIASEVRYFRIPKKLKPQSLSTLQAIIVSYLLVYWVLKQWFW